MLKRRAAGQDYMVEAVEMVRGEFIQVILQSYSVYNLISKLPR